MLIGGRQLATLLVAALAACTATTGSERVYRLPAPAQMIRLDRPALDGTLLVESLLASPVPADRRMAWRDETDGIAVRFLEHDLWSEAPPELLQSQLRSCVSSGQAAETVVPAGLDLTPDYILGGQLDRFEVLVAADGPQVSVGLDLYLTAERPRRLVWQQRFDYEVGVSEEGITGAIRGFQTALAGLCRDVINLMSKGDTGRSAGGDQRARRARNAAASSSITAR